MEQASPKIINELFLQKIASEAGIAEFEAEATGFVRKRLRETSFARKVLPPQYVVKTDLHPSINHDGVVKIVDIEPDSHAMALNFRGEATYKYVEGERYEIPFFDISSENYQKTENELLAYNMPITDVIERNSVLDIHKQEDTIFLEAVNAAIASHNGGAKAITGSYDADGTVKRGDFKRLFDLLDADELLTATILMDSKMYNRLMLYPQTIVGDSYASEVTINGYTYGQFMGKRLVVSNKVSLLDNKIYAFTSPEFLGEFDILEDIKFWLKKERNLITFANYETVGLGIGNTAAMAKITLS
jgi:hypothetical protein